MRERKRSEGKLIPGVDLLEDRRLLSTFAGIENNIESGDTFTLAKPAPPDIAAGAGVTVTPAVDDLNDQISEALQVSVGSTTSGFSIDPDTDVDMFGFTVAAGQTVSFDVDRASGSLLDSYIRLFNSAGAQLASNDDANGPGETASPARESFLEYTFAAAGTYYLGVSGFNNASYSATAGTGDVSGSTGAYSLSLGTFDNNDQISEAMGTTVGGSSSGSISTGTDVDMYRFTVSAGQTVSFDVDRASGSTLDSYIRLFDAAGAQLASNDDANGPGETASPARESFLEYTFAAAGTYYLGVSGFNNASYSATAGTGDVSGSTGAYSLSLGTFDNNDQISEAMGTTVGGSSSGSISTGTDVDMYRFTVSAGQTVSFDVDRASGSTLDSYIRLFDAAGAQLASNDDANGPGETASPARESFLEYTFAAAGTYYLGVSGFNNASYSATAGTGDVSGSTGAYSLSLGTFDNNDQISEAMGTTVGGSSSGSISTGTDVDMYRFTVAAGQTVSFDIDRASGSTLDSYIRLFNSAGALLALNDDANGPGETASPARESFLQFTFAAAGTYYLGVSGFFNASYSATAGTGDVSGSTGAYSLIVLNVSTARAQADGSGPLVDEALAQVLDAGLPRRSKTSISESVLSRYISDRFAS